MSIYLVDRAPDKGPGGKWEEVTNLRVRSHSRKVIKLGFHDIHVEFNSDLSSLPFVVQLHAEFHRANAKSMRFILAARFQQHLPLFHQRLKADTLRPEGGPLTL